MIRSLVFWEASRVNAKITFAFFSTILVQGATAIGTGGNYWCFSEGALGRYFIMDVKNYASMIDISLLQHFAACRAVISHLVISYSLIRSS
jgi:hypothetical protein